MNLPVIMSSQTSTNQPEEIITFNKWWIETLNVFGDSNGNMRGLVVLAKFGTKSDESMVFNGEKINFNIDNIIQEAQTNETLAGVISAIIQYVGSKAIETGVASEILN
jgi:hypothetical protein